MQDQKSIALLIALGCLSMFGMAAVLVFFVIKYQRNMFEKESRIQLIKRLNQINLFRASVEAEERQKEIIANNLHDSVNPMLTYLKYSLTKHQSNFLENKFAHTDLEKDKDLIDRTINEIRNICHDLIPVTLFDFGLLRSLRQFTETLNNSGHIQARFICPDLDSVDSEFSRIDQVSIFRACQEILNNILKHAHCTEMSLSVLYEEKNLCIRFDHNGIGITNAELNELGKKGLGLNSLKSRVLLLHARLDYTREEQLSSVKLQIPITT